MPDLSDILSDLPSYGDWRPTSFDARGVGLPDRQSWKVLPVTQTRDSGVLERSNFRTALASLRTADPNGDGFEVHRFGHWGPGWIEIIIIDPEGPAASEAAVVVASFESYPVLSDDDYSELEWSEASEAWRNMSTRDRIHACARYRVSIFAARRDDVPESPTGEMIGYLAGEG